MEAAEIILDELNKNEQKEQEKNKQIVLSYYPELDPNLITDLKIVDGVFSFKYNSNDDKSGPYICPTFTLDKVQKILGEVKKREDDLYSKEDAIAIIISHYPKIDQKLIENVKIENGGIIFEYSNIIYTVPAFLKPKDLNPEKDGVKSDVNKIINS